MHALAAEPEAVRRLDIAFVMKRLLLGFVLGVITTVCGLWGWQYWSHRGGEDLALFDIARTTVESSLSGTRVLDVAVSPRSKAVGNYVYDKLYDAHVTYEKQGQIKRITAPFGTYRGHWIIPNNTDLAILDDRAEVVYRRATEPLK